MLKKHCNLQYDRALGYVMLYTKINKKWSNIHQKTTLKSMLQFWSILEPTWLYFGKVLGDKPRWHQIGSKINPKIYLKNNHLFDHPKIDFWTILGPKLAPHRGKQPSHFRCFFDYGAFLAPKAPQEPSKRPPGTPKTFPRALLRPIVDDFGVQLHGFWNKLTDFPPPTWWILQPTNKPNSQSANQPTNPYIQTSLHP